MKSQVQREAQPNCNSDVKWVGGLAAFAVLSLVMFAFVGHAVEVSESPSIELKSVEIGAVSAGTAGLLLSGQAGGTVEGALIWSLSERDADDRVSVPYVIEVDGRTLLAGDRGRHCIIGFYAYAVDVDGNVVGYIADGLVLESEKFRKPISSSGLKFIGRFNLAPGHYTLRVMVQNNTSGAYFMSWSILNIPHADDVSQNMLPPLFPDVGSRWVVATQHDLDTDMAGVGGSPGVPAARPTLVENQPTAFYLGGGGWNEDAVIEVRIVNEIGRTVSEPLAAISGDPIGEFRFRRIDLTPVDLPPGDYSLILTLTDEQTTEVLRRALPLTVVRKGRPGNWASKRAPGEAGGEDSIPEVGREARKTSKKEIRAAYRRALVPLGEGDPVAARRKVSELERRVVGNGSRANLAELSEVEMAEAKALAKADPTCLMPLALLHRDLYRGYAARRQGLLASHSRGMAISFAEQLGQAKPYFGFSEGLLVNFAADLAQSGGSHAAQDLLKRALLLNRGYLPALLSLGFSLERDSDYLEAADVYQTLVDTHPESDEGRLRLAINLIRTGRDETGEEILRSLIENGATPWVQVVASQELVRVMSMKRKRLPEAEREVRSALGRMPHDQRLWILLAAILERSNRHDEAIEVLGMIPPPGRGVSPRARYSEWPALGVRASQAHLSRRAAEAVPALKEALTGRGGGG
jgi:tetratricopeptide (TPR) repeat protein